MPIYGLEHDIKYSSTKSNLVIFCCKRFKDIHIPTFVLNYEILTRVNKYVNILAIFSLKISVMMMIWLGSIRDDDMARQYKRMCAQSNALIRKLYVY